MSEEIKKEQLLLKLWEAYRVQVYGKYWLDYGQHQKDDLYRAFIAGSASVLVYILEHDSPSSALMALFKESASLVTEI